LRVVEKELLVRDDPTGKTLTKIRKKKSLQQTVPKLRKKKKRPLKRKKTPRTTKFVA